MQKWFTIFLPLILVVSLHTSVLADIHPLPQPVTDTIITKTKPDTTDRIENKVIDEVIVAKKPSKEKTEYLSQVTKYGFKNLFKNYSYNSAMPYSTQVNPYAEKYMQDYLNSHKDYLLHLKATSSTYFNFIDGILTQYGLPKELKYLAVIESDLKSNALSVAGARGPWQFMTYTAKDYGLIVNQNQDDRTDYSKSTNAAAKYLLSLYKDLKDWLLVIAAYNGGPGRVYSAIKKSGSRDFWKLQYYLPEESRNHVKKFIATHYIMETGTNNSVANSKFNYSRLSGDTSSHSPQLSSEEKSNADSTEISGRYMAKVIAQNISMGLKEFNHYNPGLDDALATGATYTLQLPGDKMKEFFDKKYDILNESVEQLLGNVRMDSKTEYGHKPQRNKKGN
ncbi:MAG: lytic transglycosylase domain-containing protein [Ginsengibacter sp.]